MEPDGPCRRVTGVQPLDDGFIAVYQREYRRLVGLLIVIGGIEADAEEIAQEAFVRLLEGWNRVSRYERPDAWVRTVAVRLLLSRRRRTVVAWRHRSDLVRPPANDGTAADLAADLDAAFQQLAPSHRAVVVLHHLCDLSVEEVAVELKVPVGTVKSRLARARTALGPLMAESSASEGSTP